MPKVRDHALWRSSRPRAATHARYQHTSVLIRAHVRSHWLFSPPGATQTRPICSDHQSLDSVALDSRFALKLCVSRATNPLHNRQPHAPSSQPSGLVHQPPSHFCLPRASLAQPPRSCEVFLSTCLRSDLGSTLHRSQPQSLHDSGRGAASRTPTLGSLSHEALFRNHLSLKPRHTHLRKMKCY